MEKRSAVLFDFGGTLCDTEGVVLSALNSALLKFNLGEIKKEEFLSLFSGSFHESLPRRFPALQDQKLLSDFSIQFNEEKKNSLPSFFPGIPSLLKELSDKGFSLYIVSAANEGFIENVLEREGVQILFGKILGVESGKSKLEKIRKVFALGNISPEECVYVGDTSGDILDAKSAGIYSVAVLWGYHDKYELSNAGAKNFAQSPAEVVSLCEKILGRNGGKNA